MSDNGKEFRLKMQLRNNRMLECREKLGWTQQQAAVASGVPHQYFGQYELMKTSPVEFIRWKKPAPVRMLAWKKYALKIAQTYDVPPEYLWPKAVQEATGSAYVTIKMCSEEANALLGSFGQDPIKKLDEGDLSRKVDEVLAALDPREQKILRIRFGIGRPSDHTLEEVSKEIGITNERVRQIESKALRKLRHPSLAKKLKIFVDEDVDEDGSGLWARKRKAAVAEAAAQVDALWGSTEKAVIAKKQKRSIAEALAIVRERAERKMRPRSVAAENADLRAARRARGEGS